MNILGLNACHGDASCRHATSGIGSVNQITQVYHGILGGPKPCSVEVSR